MKHYLSAKESVALLRRDLRKSFPGTKFSVRMSRGTGYGSCYVSWKDGPTVAEVDAVAGPYEGASFDGMTDSTNYHDRAIVIDADGKVWLTGIKYVLTSRERSEVAS